MTGTGCHKHCGEKPFSNKPCSRHHHPYPSLPYRIFLKVLLVFITIVLFVIFVIFLVLHPHKPRFYLQNARVRQLNLNNGLLNSSLEFTVVTHNPNDRIGVFYGSLSTYAFYVDQQITTQSPLSPFYQDHKDTNTLPLILSGNSVPLAPVVCDHLNYETQRGLLSLSLTIDGRVRWKVGAWTSGQYHLNVNCWAILGLSNEVIGGQVPLQPGTRCHVEV